MSSRSKLSIGVLAFIIVVVVGIVALQRKGQPALQPLLLRQEQDIEIPNLTLEDFAGNKIELHSFVGTPFVINSWAAWCPFCRKELVDFADVKREFGEKVTIVAIDRAESQDTAKRYIDELGVTDDLVFLLDPHDSFYQAIGGFAMPETIFVDAQGNIIEHKRGPMEYAEIRQKVGDMITS